MLNHDIPNDFIPNDFIPRHFIDKIPKVIWSRPIIESTLPGPVNTQEARLIKGSNTTLPIRIVIMADHRKTLKAEFVKLSNNIKWTGETYGTQSKTLWQLVIQH